MVNKSSQSRSLSIIVFIVGVWLLLSPYLLGYSVSQAIWQQAIGGLIVAIVAAVRYMMPAINWPSWINVAIGAWLVISPFVTGYSEGVAYWNQIVFGLVVVGAALWDATSHLAMTSHHVHHGGGAHPIR